jgi:hypothetical protein
LEIFRKHIVVSADVNHYLKYESVDDLLTTSSFYIFCLIIFLALVFNAMFVGEGTLDN